MLGCKLEFCGLGCGRGVSYFDIDDYHSASIQRGEFLYQLTEY
jgi:hypothetical protein